MSLLEVCYKCFVIVRKSFAVSVRVVKLKAKQTFNSFHITTFEVPIFWQTSYYYSQRWELKMLKEESVFVCCLFAKFLNLRDRNTNSIFGQVPLRFIGKFNTSSIFFSDSAGCSIYKLQATVLWNFLDCLQQTNRDGHHLKTYYVLCRKCVFQFN